MRRLGRPPYESMTDESGPPPPVEPSELAPDRCPNCGGKLKVTANPPGGGCRQPETVGHVLHGLRERARGGRSRGEGRETRSRGGDPGRTAGRAADRDTH